jgi:hypothetical protein
MPLERRQSSEGAKMTTQTKETPTAEDIVKAMTPEKVAETEKAIQARKKAEADAKQAEGNEFRAMSDSELRNWKVQRGGGW